MSLMWSTLFRAWIEYKNKYTFINHKIKTNLILETPTILQSLPYTFLWSQRKARWYGVELYIFLL